MNIQTDRIIKVFANDGQYGRMYSTSISSKKQDGTYQTSYVTLKFRKEVTLENETQIEIQKGWLIPTNDKNKIAIFISEFKTTGQIAEEAKQDDQLKDFSNETLIINEEDLPF